MIDDYYASEFTVRENVLTDGSKTHDVIGRSKVAAVEIACLSKRAANSIAAMLNDSSKVADVAIEAL